MCNLPGKLFVTLSDINKENKNVKISNVHEVFKPEKINTSVSDALEIIYFYLLFLYQIAQVNNSSRYFVNSQICSIVRKQFIHLEAIFKRCLK